MKHKSSINKMSNSELAQRIGDLRYDSLVELFNALSKKFETDSDADRERGREKLAIHLLNISFLLKDMEIEMSEAWRISEPHMMENN